MSGLEVNKILASIIIAILVVTIIGFVGNLIVPNDQEDNAEIAYKIDIPESDTSNLTNETTKEATNCFRCLRPPARESVCPRCLWRGLRGLRHRPWRSSPTRSASDSAYPWWQHP